MFLSFVLIPKDNYDALYPLTDTVPLVVPDAVPLIVPDALPLTVAPDNDAVAGIVPTVLEPHSVAAGIVPDALPLTVPLIEALQKLREQAEE